MLLAAVLVVVTVAVATPVTPVGAASAQQNPTAPTCTGATIQPIDQGSFPFLVPAWADGAGWSNPDQAATIVQGDVDGDGIGELVGRSGSGFETYTWDSTEAAQGHYGKAWDPVPGQWRQIVPLASGPSAKTGDGWWDPSVSGTVRLGDVDGDGADELITRDRTKGVQIFRWNVAGRNWSPTAIQGPAWIDGTADETSGTDWGQSHPDHYSTIQAGDVDGDGAAELVGRGRDGVETWSYRTGATTVSPVLADPAASTPDQYSTMQLADLDGDGAAELVIRTASGLASYRYTGGQWVALDGAGAPFPDFDVNTGTDWTNAAYWPSIHAADLDGDGRAEVFGRSTLGLEAWSWRDGSWTLLARQSASSALSDLSGWAPAEYSSTIQAADVLPQAGSEVIARGTYGLIVLAVVGGQWLQQPYQIGGFSDGNGWNAAFTNTTETSPVVSRYGSIRPVTVQAGQPQLVIGRDTTGVRTYRIDGSTPTAGFPAYTNLVLADGTPVPDTLPPASPGVSPTLQLQLDQLTPEGRAFWYLDAKAARNFGWSMPAFIDTPGGPVTIPRPTIVDELRNQAVDVASLHAAVQGYDPGDANLAAQNVDRETYEAVRQDVADWTGATDQVRRILLGPQGIQQLMQQSFVANSGQVQNVAPAFEKNSKLYALYSDLVWGLIAGISVFFPAALVGDAAAAFFTFSFGMEGAAMSGALGLHDPNAKIEAEAAQLQANMVNQFCGASAYVGYANDQIAQDLGLLTTSGNVISQMFIPSTSFSTIVSGMVTAQDVWIWQQFAQVGPDTSSGDDVFWLGVCRGSSGCPWSTTSDGVWVAPEDAQVSYRLIEGKAKSGGQDCSTGVIHSTKYAAFDDLPSDPTMWAAPRKTDTSEPGTEGATPMGLGGWHLEHAGCN